MRITRIKKLECGIFNNFEWGRELPDFCKFNLIYGQNGSGKTTLSRVLRDLELKRTPEYGVLISTDGPDIHGANFRNAGMSIRVFNSEFVSENVFSIEGKNVSPIIVLGTKNKDKLDKLAEKRMELESAKSKQAIDLDKKSTAMKSLNDHCQSRGNAIKRMLAGPDDNTYLNYNKTRYRQRALEIFGNGNQSMHKLDNQARARLLALHHATPKREIDEPRYPKRDWAALRDMVVDLLSQTVISKPIQSLMDDPDKAEWVRRGMDFYNDNECPFCKKQMPEQRKLDLESHFDAEYEDTLTLLDRLATHVRDVRESFLSDVKAPDCEIIHDSLHDAYMAAKAGLDDYRDNVKAYLDSLEATISHKRRYLFKSLAPDGILPPPDDGPSDNLIVIIREHNEMCLHLASRVADAREKLEYDYIAEDHEFVQLHADSLVANRTADESANRVAALIDEVSTMESDVADHSKAAHDFNDDLSRYLGHGELRLDVREHGYAISRNGDANPFPSDGEKTAIALLYFLQSLKGDRFNIKEGIIVLDDPISSLDTNALFAAIGFIRERTQAAGQLFVLTHNFTFFREVREWFKSKNRPNRRCDAQFYMLSSRSEGENRQSEIRKLDPLLKDYGSDYHYLFKCVWRGSKSLDSLESNYHLPNMARRLLDSFLAFRQPNITDLKGRMNKIEFDAVKKQRIYAFINAHSHNFTIAEPEHAVDLLSEAPGVLSDIMNLMKGVDPEHYSAMEALAKKT